MLVVPETNRTSSTEVMSSTASVSNLTWMFQLFQNTSIFSLATRLSGNSASVLAALTTCFQKI